MYCKFGVFGIVNSLMKQIELFEVGRWLSRAGLVR